MKKNLGLVIILVTLLMGTYFFQEKRNEREYETGIKHNLLIEKPIVKLKWNNQEAVKKNGRWWMGDKLLSHNLFKQIEEKISKFKKVKDIQGDKANYFTNPYLIEVNGELWALGDMTLDRQGFYVAKGDAIMVAFIDGGSYELTQEESDLEKVKLDEFKNLLNAEIKEKQLFRFYPKLPIGSVVIQTDGSPSYELDFVKNQIIPAPIQGIETVENLQQKFISLVTQMTIQDEIPFQSFFKKMSSLTFKTADDTLVFEMWLKSKDKADAVILDPKNKRAFLMVGGSLKIFFIHMQDYWDKKIIPSKEFKAFDRLKMTFIQGEKSCDVTLINSEPLKFEATRCKVKTANMDALMFILLNLKDRDQADRVSQLSTTERKQYLSEEHLRIELMGKDLILVRKPEELIVANLTQGFKAHFNILDKNFHGKFEDVLE